MAKSGTKMDGVSSSDDFYESLASSSLGGLEGWAEPEDQYRDPHAPDSSRTTAIITLIVAFLVTLALALWFTQGLSAIQSSLNQSPAAQTSH
jgi:hypothetical protein